MKDKLIKIILRVSAIFFFNLRNKEQNSLHKYKKKKLFICHMSFFFKKYIL